MNKKLYQLVGSKSVEVVNLCMTLFDNYMYGNKSANVSVFAKLCGFGKYTHCRIEWDGNCSTCCQPDKFSVYKNGVKYDFLADSLIYDGVAAKAYHISKSV